MVLYVLRPDEVLWYFPSAIPISDEGVERVDLLVDDNKSELIVDLHTKTDLGEGCGPVCRYLCLL